MGIVPLRISPRLETADMKKTSGEDICVEPVSGSQNLQYAWKSLGSYPVQIKLVKLLSLLTAEAQMRLGGSVNPSAPKCFVFFSLPPADSLCSHEWAVSHLALIVLACSSGFLILPSQG